MRDIRSIKMIQRPAGNACHNSQGNITS